MYPNDGEIEKDELNRLLAAFDEKMAEFEILANEIEELATEIDIRAAVIEKRRSPRLPDAPPRRDFLDWLNDSSSN